MHVYLKVNLAYVHLHVLEAEGAEGGNVPAHFGFDVLDLKVALTSRLPNSLRSLPT